MLFTGKISFHYCFLFLCLLFSSSSSFLHGSCQLSIEFSTTQHTHSLTHKVNDRKKFLILLKLYFIESLFK